MKKILSMVLACVLVFALTASAFAVGSSPVRPISDGAATAALPEVEKEGIVIVDADHNEVGTLPEEAIEMYDAAAAEKKLSDEDLASFQAAYEAAQAEEDVTVVDFFWFNIAPDYVKELDGGKGVKMGFTVPGWEEGDTVIVKVNGEEIPANDVVDNGDGTVTVYLYKFGAVALELKKAA